MANEFMSWLVGGQASTKELSLDEASRKIRDAIYSKFLPAKETVFSAPATVGEASLYVCEIFAGYAIVEKGAEHFKVRFAVTDAGIEVDGELVPVERIWVEKAASGEAKEASADESMDECDSVSAEEAAGAPENEQQ